MENRFGVKDLILFILVAALIVLVILGMLQYDRQWALMRQTNTLLNQQTTDLAHIRRLLEQGGVPASAAAGTTQPAMAGFERILKAQAAPDYAQGDDLVDTFGVVPDKLTPLISSDAYSAVVQGYILDTLVDRDPNTLKWIPRLAQSWKISDDQLTIDFQLRRGITFSDGSDLTADDVVYTFDLARNPQIEAPRVRAYLDKLDKVEKTGDYSVRFVFKEPYFKSFETAGATGIMSKKFYSQFSPTDFNRSTGLLMGSGPYRLPDPKNWRPEPGKPVELVRNERYWGPTPSFNRLVWKVIENPSARATAFRNGDTDIYGPTPDQYDLMVADPNLTARTHHYALEVPNAGFQYIGWNEKVGRDGKPSQFADPRVRRALTLLTDRTSICQNIMRGYATVISGPFSTLTPQADPSVHPLPYDPSEAEKLLAEAGFVRRGSQIVGSDGQPFHFKLMYATTSEVAKRVVSFIRDSYAKAGILVEPDPTEWSVLIKRLDDRQFDAVLLGWSGTIEFDAYQIFDSSQMAGTGDDFIQYKDERVDKAIEAARATVDDTKRMPLWHEVHRLLHEDQPYTFLFISKDLEFVNGRIHGIEVTKTGLNPALEWYVPKGMQKYTN